MKLFLSFILLLISSFNAIGQEMTMDHSHMPITVPVNAKNPALSLHLAKDSMSGYNLTLALERYTMMPPPEGLSMSDSMTPKVNSVSGFIEGHAHLYVNGIKIQRIYGKYTHIPQSLFKGGVNIVSVTLNNHGHMYWVSNDKKVIATLYINEKKSPFVTYKFESFPAK
jgi:hypothetical protein